MKKWIQQPVICLVLGGLCFGSCKKDGDDDKAKTNTEKISLAIWKYDKVEIDANKDGTADTPIPPGFIEACETDNTIAFKADNSGILDEGAKKCDPADPQSANFTWSFKNNETVISFPAAIITGVDGDVTIKTLTETSLVLTKEISGDPYIPGTVNVILTLKH